ncbi:MAG: peptidoglycan glycosyltransferase [Lachnospiraceae bacterium]|nr:peptidoglycan glycosyltransferase [Lachnospiraceae bacterium]
MVDIIKEWLNKFIKTVVRSRLFVFGIIMIVLFIFVFQRLFVLQVVNGEDYLNNYTMSIEKEIEVDGARGNIYDRNGLLLAHNELSYTITLEDDGSYDTTEEKNEALNSEINMLIDMVESNGDSIVNDLYLYMDPGGELSFLVDGTALMGFRRDVYGRADISDLIVNSTLGYDEARATTEQMFDYLLDEFGVDESEYGRYRAYQIMVVRYALSLNSYQKYITTDVAQDVSDETVAMVEEHLYELQGVNVNEGTKRVYNYPEYFSHIIGYTGKISADEYETLSTEDDSYTLNDTVGKAGIEQVMEEELQGQKGSQTVYVNNVGQVLEVKDSTDPSAGNDVYLSIDANLQMAVYDLLEQEIAGILYANIVDSKEMSETQIDIPIYDVYSALVANNVIDINLLPDADPNSYQYKAYQAYSGYRDTVYATVTEALQSDTPFEKLSDEMQDYITYMITYLQDTGVFDTTDVSTTDSVYSNWKNGTISAKEYLEYAIESSWIQVTSFEMNEKYADTAETYQALVPYMVEQMKTNTAFDRLIYKYLIYDGKISGNTLCLILFEQGILEQNEADIKRLESGALDSCTFLKEKIKNLEITPAQLALDPCTGSCVLMDPETGELLACVSYPGYDTNRLANSMDAAYYNQLLIDQSLPLYNNATQQATAPGSTFKLVTATTGLMEGVIDADTVINDPGEFTELDYDLKCWVYPGSHGEETVTTAIRDSCNTYFCEVGYRLSMVDGEYDEEAGISKLQKYADEYGLGSETDIEISEGVSNVADEYPIPASIGQSDNRYTTVQLCRYAAAIANEGTVYDLTLLDKLTDSEGYLLKTYEPSVENEMDDITESTWSILHEGMQMVIGTHAQFDDLKTSLAGKTGTAQENENRANHALFIGYAPVSDPQIAIATRIAYGYNSDNACDLADLVLKYYFGEASAEELITGQAETDVTTENAFTD